MSLHISDYLDQKRNNIGVNLRYEQGDTSSPESKIEYDSNSKKLNSFLPNSKINDNLNYKDPYQPTFSKNFSSDLDLKFEDETYEFTPNYTEEPHEKHQISIKIAEQNRQDSIPKKLDYRLQEKSTLKINEFSDDSSEFIPFSEQSKANAFRSNSKKRYQNKPVLKEKVLNEKFKSVNIQNYNPT